MAWWGAPLLLFGPEAQTGPGAVTHPALPAVEATSANEPVAKERLPAAALAGPGVYGPGRADSRAGRAPLVKGNNPVQQDNRRFPAGRRDLISDPTGGQGRTLCSLGWGRRSKPGKVHHLLQVQIGPGSNVWRDRPRLGMRNKEDGLIGSAPWAGRPMPGSSPAMLELGHCLYQECPSSMGQRSPPMLGYTMVSVCCLAEFYSPNFFYLP